MYSPSPLRSGVPTTCPVDALFCVISKSPDVIDPITAVTDPPASI